MTDIINCSARNVFTGAVGVIWPPRGYHVTSTCYLASCPKAVQKLHVELWMLRWRIPQCLWGYQSPLEYRFDLLLCHWNKKSEAGMVSPIKYTNPIYPRDPNKFQEASKLQISTEYFVNVPKQRNLQCIVRKQSHPYRQTVTHLLVYILHKCTMVWIQGQLYETILWVICKY